MIISIYNRKGGAGRTTTAMALASAIAADDVDVEVLDAAPNNDCAEWAAEAADSGTPLPFAVELANSATIDALCRTAKGDAEKFLIIDYPRDSYPVNAVYESSDLVILPTTTNAMDIQATFETLNELGYHGKDSNAIAAGCMVLLNRIERDACSGRPVPTLSELIERNHLRNPDARYCEQTIAWSDELSQKYGSPFDGELYGYEGVWTEIKRELRIQLLPRKKKSVTFWLAADEKEELTALAKRRGKTVTQIIREGIATVERDE